jgi:ABC-type antimicrobial peptide transport system permease subunit
MVLREGAGTLLLGLVAGAAGGLATGRALSGLLFGVQPGDPGVLLAAGALLAGVAVLATWLPARRAASIAPGEVLRSDVT